MQKIKLFLESDKGKDLLIILIVLLVGLGSFELGRLSQEKSSEGLRIEFTEEYKEVLEGQGAGVIFAKEAPANTLGGENGNFFASKRGKKYYPLGCSAGASLKEENKIWFDTRDEAEKAGYELSGSCR